MGTLKEQKKTHTHTHTQKKSYCGSKRNTVFSVVSLSLGSTYEFLIIRNWYFVIETVGLLPSSGT